MTTKSKNQNINTFSLENKKFIMAQKIDPDIIAKAFGAKKAPEGVNYFMAKEIWAKNNKK
jgi:hypothetical protein